MNKRDFLEYKKNIKKKGANLEFQEEKEVVGETHVGVDGDYLEILAVIHTVEPVHPVQNTYVSKSIYITIHKYNQFLK